MFSVLFPESNLGRFSGMDKGDMMKIQFPVSANDGFGMT